MTNAEILRIWNSLRDHRKIEARVYSCVISAFENNGGNEAIDTGRAVAVLRLIFPGVELGAVPSEIRGTRSDKNYVKLRQTDFTRLMEVVCRSADQRTSRQTSPIQNGSGLPHVTSDSPAPPSSAGFGVAAENKLVEDAAVQVVRKYYESGGWSVHSVERDKCGFDLECTNGAAVEQVEVKGVSGTEQCFIITAGEVRQARENPRFVLAVVTAALSPSPTLTKFSGAEFGKRFNLAAIQYRASLKQ